MDISSVMGIVTPVLLGVLVAVAIWAVVEIAITVRRARATVDAANEVIEQAKPIVEQAKPLVDHATLTIDAVNLEIMRVDGILEDVSKVTDTASGAAEAIDAVTNAPVKAVTGLVDALRSGTKDRVRSHRVEKAVEQAARIAATVQSQAASEAPEPAAAPAPAPEPAPAPAPVPESSAQPRGAYTVVEPALGGNAKGNAMRTVRMETITPKKVIPVDVAVKAPTDADRS